MIINWIVRGLLIAGAAVTEWFVGKDAWNFGVVQGFITLAVFAAAVALIAFWPWRRREPDESAR